jgi:hypothetical protein
MMSVINRTSRNVTRAAEFCCAMAMRLVPRQYRFEVALLLARATVPVLRHTAAYREQQIKKFHGAGEIALHLVLNALSKNETPFDPPIVVNGFEHFERAYARGKGVLVIGHHAALTLFMVRLFYDKGFDPVVITPDARLRVGGTLAIARTVQPSPTFLVRLRSRLRSGYLVCGMPDRGEHHARRTVEFATATGQVILAPAMIQVAARCGAEVLFTAVHLEDRRLVATITTPLPSSIGTVSALIEDFITFVREHTAVPGAAGSGRANGFRSRRSSTQAQPAWAGSDLVKNSSSSTEAALVTPRVD